MSKGFLVKQLLILAMSSQPAYAATLSYDHENRLIEYVDDNSVHTQYIYDALGRRIKRIVDANSTNPQTTRFLYSGGHVLEERDRQETMRKRYVYGAAPDDVLRMSENVNQSWFKDHYYLKDNQNTVYKLTSNRGSVEESYEYSDYGETLDPDNFQKTSNPSSMGNEYLFTGRRLDQESGLYYYRLRHMDPSVGQFIQRDPAGSWTDGINLGNGHSYVGNNPQTFIDPSGLIHAKADGGTGPTGPVADEKKKKKLKDIPFEVIVRGLLSGVGLGFASNVVDLVPSPTETLARTEIIIDSLFIEPAPKGDAGETLKEKGSSSYLKTYLVFSTNPVVEGLRWLGGELNKPVSNPCKNESCDFSQKGPQPETTNLCDDCFDELLNNAPIAGAGKFRKDIVESAIEWGLNKAKGLISKLLPKRPNIPVTHRTFGVDEVSSLPADTKVYRVEYPGQTPFQPHNSPYFNPEQYGLNGISESYDVLYMATDKKILNQLRQDQGYFAEGRKMYETTLGKIVGRGGKGTLFKDFKFDQTVVGPRDEFATGLVYVIPRSCSNRCY